MKQRLRPLVGLALVAAGAVALMALALPARAAGTLTYCMSGSPEGFDIAQYELAFTIEAAGITLYDQMTTTRPGTTELIPGLAESWQVSDDGLTYTFKLRRGVRFHETPWFKPTRELNADDVLFSFRRMMDKTHPAHAAARNGFAYWAGMEMPAVVKSVDKVDAMTVRFTLTRPDAPFLSNLSIWSIGSVLSAEYAAQLQAAGKLEQLNTHPVGTGPFVFKSYQKDAVVRYAANATYWGGAPKVDQLVFAITADPDVSLQRLRAGECLVTYVKGESVPQVEADPSLRVASNRPLLTEYLAPNVQRAPTSSKAFREALWLAIDKLAFIRGRGGRRLPAVSLLPPAMWSHDAALPERSDPERARQLVKASGYDGRELTLYVRDSSVGRRAGELLQADWARIGVKVRLHALEAGELRRRTAQGEHDLMHDGWASDNGDPDNFLTPNLSCAAVAAGSNKSRWCHPPLDALLAQARRTTDRAQRSELYRKAQQIAYDEVAVIPLTYPETFFAMHKRVGGFVTNPMDNPDFRAVSVR